MSPRRREMIALFCLPFEVCPADVDERHPEGEDATKYVMRLAAEKAKKVASSNSGIIVAADTVVVDQNKLLGKPTDLEDAFGMLTSLRGHTHQVMTGITLIDTGTGQRVDDLCTINVPMRNYSYAEITAYIASGDPLDKAGGYAIQHGGFNPVEQLTGCYAGVMGFPYCHIVRGLRVLGVEVNVDVPKECQHALGYNCQVFNEILR